MREDIYNLFKLNIHPSLNNDIKFKIYTQYYKNNSLPRDLKLDLETYFMLHHVIAVYQAELETDYMDYNYFLYSLYNHLLHTHHNNCMSLCINSTFKTYYYNTTVYNTLNMRHQHMHYPFVMGRIKYFWRIMTPDKRIQFIRSMEDKFAN